MTLMSGENLEDLLEKLDESRERLLVAIESLPDHALLTQNAVQEWTISNLLANLTAWEAELVTGLMKLDQGKKPAKLMMALKNPQGFDVQCSADFFGRDLDRIFRDWQDVRIQLERRLGSFSERQLTNPKRFKWFNGRSLSQIIALTTYEREAQFMPAVEKFAAQWGGNQLTVIS